MAHCSCASSLAGAEAGEAFGLPDGFVGDCLSAPEGEAADPGDAPPFCWKKESSVGVAPLDDEAVAEALGRCLRLGAGDGAMVAPGRALTLQDIYLSYRGSYVSLYLGCLTAGVVVRGGEVVMVKYSFHHLQRKQPELRKCGGGRRAEIQCAPDVHFHQRGILSWLRRRRPYPRLRIPLVV
jgi:hypothetical protein